MVIDDAYYEYINDPNYSSGIKLFSKSKNVLITRTFSKIYGLAGLRIGWGYGPKEIIKKLYEINHHLMLADQLYLQQHRLYKIQNG